MKKGYRLQALGYSLILFLLLPVACCLFTARAADSSPSADVKAKLEALKAEIASKAAKLKTEVNKKLQNKAYIGVVKAKSTTSITLASKISSKLVSVNQDTTYLDTTPKKRGAKKVTPSIDSVKDESNIAALGDVDDTGVLHARRIVILPPSNESKPKTYLWGQVISVSDLIAIKTKDGQTEPISKVDLETKFKINDFVIVTGIKNKNDILEASFLYVIPQSSAPKPKISTPSATPSGKK